MMRGPSNKIRSKNTTELELCRVSDRATFWCEYEAYRVSGRVEFPTNDGTHERTGRRRSVARGNTDSS